MAIRRGGVPGLQYLPVRSPVPPMSELLSFRRLLASRLRLRAVALALARSVRQVRRPMTVMRRRMASRPRQGDCVDLAVCKLPQLRPGRTRVRYCVRKSKRRTLRSRRVPGRMRRNVDDRFRATHKQVLFLFPSFVCFIYRQVDYWLALDPLKRDSDPLNIVIPYAISGWQSYLFSQVNTSTQLFLPRYILFFSASVVRIYTVKEVQDSRRARVSRVV